MAGGGDLLGVGVTAVNSILTGKGLDTISLTGCRGGDGLSVLMGTRILNPNTVGIGISTSSVGGIHILAIRILQLCGKYIDCFTSRGITRLAGLVGYPFLARRQDDNTAATTGNIRTSRCGINKTSTGIHCTIDNNLCGFQISIGSCVASTRSIGQRNKCSVGRAAVIAPLSRIINIDVNTRSQRASCTAFYQNLAAWQKRNILADCCIRSRLNRKSDITIDAQIVLRRIHKGSANIQCNRRKRHCTIKFHHKTVSCSIVSFSYRTFG